jgi:hypothetical protein
LAGIASGHTSLIKSLQAVLTKVFFIKKYFQFFWFLNFGEFFFQNFSNNFFFFKFYTLKIKFQIFWVTIVQKFAQKEKLFADNIPITH